VPAVARGSAVDTVTTNHGCTASTTTEGKSSNVIVNGTGVHRKSDKNTSHTVPVGDECPSHQTAISVGSTTVFANGFGIARIGDLYDGGEEVTVLENGSLNVFAGG
jgi:uncharacterized Zn-binding protein involved in type VI secretion